MPLPRAPARRWLLWWAACCVALASAHAAAPAVKRSVDGVVTSVVDGDSLWLAPAAGGPALEVRLQDIDAPEICQPWGPEARDALREWVLNRPVRAEVSGLDVYGRTLATLFVDTLNVNQAMVKEGHAWSTRYKDGRGRYVSEERLATALRRGFNRAGGAIMPSDFRRGHGPCQPGEGVATLARDEPAPPAAAAPAPTPSPAFRCDGRTHCSQMRSCAEATFFLKNCPGVKMDGNHDGVPCEKQWCGR